MFPDPNVSNVSMFCVEPSAQQLEADTPIGVGLNGEISKLTEGDILKNSLTTMIGSVLLATSTLTAEAATQIATESKVARVFNSCRIVEGAAAGGQSKSWAYDGITARMADVLAPDLDYDDFLNQIQSSIRMWQPAKHGTMTAQIDPQGLFTILLYKTNPGFEGVDGGSFAFDFRGKTYVSAQKFIVSIPRT